MLTFSRLGKLGRLGNQLFQIASTIGIANENEQTYCFPKWRYSKYFEHQLPEMSCLNYQKFSEYSSKYRKIVLKPGNWDLSGFFQSEQYFRSSSSVVRHYLKPSSSMEDYLDDKFHEILQGLTCSVHVRRGDYLKQPYHFPPLPKHYFNDAIEKLHHVDRFLFFSDDIEWCKTNFEDEKFFFVHDETEVADLFLMSKCTHHIISNSSFSWWGSWLNPSENKRIISPDRWFGPAVELYSKPCRNSIFIDNFEKIRLRQPRYSQLSYPLIYLFFQIRDFFLNLPFVVAARFRRNT